MKNIKAEELLNKFREGNCTDEEKALIEYWAHNLGVDGESGLSETDIINAQSEMWLHIDPEKKRTVVKHLSWLSAAAAILILVSIATLFIIRPGKKDEQSIASASFDKIKPGGNKAILTLANGKKIVLNDASNGKIAEQSGIRISKKADGQLVYSIVGSNTGADGKLAYNIIETPRGGQYQINLPDGSKVWLNAASSLRFPVKFDDKRREVQLSGEGYFEIKHLEPVKGESVPFLVKTISPAAGRSGQTVEVLGTHFNINAYDDESTIKTTLLEGSVRVTALSDRIPTPGSKLLKPGQQSVLGLSDIAVVAADTEAAVAWKNGYFRFNDENLESIMRKISKWYDVDVVYEDDKLRKEPFSGVITRFGSASELLKNLELTGVVKFRLDGKKIFVTDNKTN